MVIAHNHPSGNLKPSKIDEALTQKLKNAAALLDVNLLDHLIVSNAGFYSFADEGKM
jgi:DNA repair protein RadC